MLARRWVHVFEEDTAQGAVYRPDSPDLPLSRRPREILAIAADGSAEVSVPGPADRPTVQPATWTLEGDTVVIRAGGGGRGGKTYRLVDVSADRIVVQQ